MQTHSAFERCLESGCSIEATGCMPYGGCYVYHMRVEAVSRVACRERIVETERNSTCNESAGRLTIVTESKETVTRVTGSGLAMHALAGNLLQVGMLGLGVSLLIVWINYLKAERDRTSSEEPDERSAEVLAASAARSRTGP